MADSSSADFSASNAPFSLLVSTLDAMESYGPAPDPLTGAPRFGLCQDGAVSSPADRTEPSSPAKDVVGAYTSGIGSLTDESA